MTTISQQQTITGLTGDWAQAQTLAFNQFDPSTGGLVDAVFTTTGSIDASASIENLAPVAATVNLNVGATIYSWAPDIDEDMATIQPDATATITDFSLTNGDRLNLIGLLGGAPLKHDLSNLDSFVNVTGQVADPAGGVDTTLSINGPGGAASVVLGSSGPISVAALLSNDTLVLPPH